MENRARLNSLIAHRKLSKRSFLAKKHWLDQTKNRKRLLTLKKTRAKLKHLKTIRLGRVFVRATRTNTFLTLAYSKKQKRKNIVRFKCSAGLLKYKGKKKGTQMARGQVARFFSRRLCSKNYRLIDVHFVKGLGGIYRFILRGFVKKSFIIIRSFKIRRLHSHGAIRPKKARRK